MSGRAFLDTNLWVYLFSNSENEDDRKKKIIVSSLLKDIAEPVVSVQVLSEMSSVFLKKLKFPIDRVRSIIFEMRETLEVVSLDESDITFALDILDRYNFSWYDALIAASAISARAEIIYSEDMQHEMVVDKDMMIKNPFIE